MNLINNIISAVSGVLYQPWCVPLILLAGGIYLTVRSRFIQVRLFREAFKVILEKPASENGISSFGALMVSTCLLYTSPSPRDGSLSRMPSSA